jgi:L,D-transpeptidase YcbB
MSRSYNVIQPNMTRRHFAGGLTLFGLSAALCASTSPYALAAPADPSSSLIGSQAEWEQKYDTDGQMSIPRTSTPLISAQTIAATEAAIQSYRQLAAQGGWAPVPTSKTLQIGSRGAAVLALRKRLIVTGDLDNAAGANQVFDSYVDAAVKRFQARHGLGATGVVGEQTFTMLNVPVTERIRQLELNLVRLRSFSSNLGQRHIIMNIPAAAVQTVENGVVATNHAAGVGKIDRQSPVMQAKVTEVNFNPFWTVPASIIRKDLIPKMQADPNYLSDNKIRMINGQGVEVPPNSINWNSLEAVNYRFRQDPGGDFNSLGFVRVNIPNPYGVYMHDTPAKGIFGDDFRFVSSGCVRVQNIRDYVAWILKDNSGWDRDHIDDVIRSGARLDVKLTTPVPVYWVYITAWAGDGLVQFREDIYQRDGFSGASSSSPSAALAPAVSPDAETQVTSSVHEPSERNVLPPMNDDDK